VEIVIDGMKGGFYITQGYGDSSDEPPPASRADGALDALLGDDEGGLKTNLENPDLDGSD
jgi:hypothetical protein